jgi:hypothetical protein
MNTTGITEQELIKLKFKIQRETAENSGADKDWYYYTLDIGDICLISNASDEIEKYGWTISIFDSETSKIGDVADLTTLIRILRNNTTTK